MLIIMFVLTFACFLIFLSIYCNVMLATIKKKEEMKIKLYETKFEVWQISPMETYWHFGPKKLLIFLSNEKLLTFWSNGNLLTFWCNEKLLTFLSNNSLMTFWFNNNLLTFWSNLFTNHVNNFFLCFRPFVSCRLFH